MSGSFRLTVLLDQFPELSETFIASELHELRRLGLEVQVQSAAHATNPNRQAAEGLDVVYLSEDGRRDRVLSLAWLAARHPVGVLRDLAPAARRASRFALRSPARALRRGCGARRDAPGKLLGKPSSFATHGYDIFQRPANHVEKHERAAFAVSACHYSASHLRGVVGGEAATRIHRLMVGVDGERFRRRRPYPGASTVKAVGRLVEKKGLADLVDAVALMRDRDSGLRLRIVGDGPLRPALEHKVDELGAGDSIQLLGARTHEDVRDLLEEADVLAMQCVVAADGDRDTMPVVVKEALAMEIAVVATEEVGLPEVVKPGWGRLVPPHDPAALAPALDEVLAMPASDRVGMGRAGRGFVLTECSLTRETERLVALIQASSAG